jgi:hypothetical protein
VLSTYLVFLSFNPGNVGWKGFTEWQTISLDYLKVSQHRENTISCSVFSLSVSFCLNQCDYDDYSLSYKIHFSLILVLLKFSFIIVVLLQCLAQASHSYLGVTSTFSFFVILGLYSKFSPLKS